MHLGLEPYVPIVLYLGFLLVVGLSIFWRPVVGIYYLTPIIPAQTFRDRLSEYPLGASVITVVLIAVAIGLIRRGEPVVVSCGWKAPLLTYASFTFVSLCLGSFYLGNSLPISFGDPRVGNWRNYITMLFLLFLVAAAVKTKKEMQIIVLLICLSVLLFDKNFWGTVSSRDFSSYSDDLRTDAGAVGYAGLNGLAAFEAQISMALMAFAAYEKRPLYRLGYIGIAFYSALCLMYSLSREGYIALLAGWLFLGLARYRILLVLLIAFGCTWTTLVPNAVVERVQMTYNNDSGEVDHSSETRLQLWEDAMQIFSTNPVTGSGFDTYAYLGRVGNYRDTHNIYIKVLVETGVVGILIFVWVLLTTFWEGFRLFYIAEDPFYASLGLALAVWMVCSITVNFFGDRWTYLQVDGYLWLLGGLVVRARQIEDDTANGLLPEESESPEELENFAFEAVHP